MKTEETTFSMIDDEKADVNVATAVDQIKKLRAREEALLAAWQPKEAIQARMRAYDGAIAAAMGETVPIVPEATPKRSHASPKANCPDCGGAYSQHREKNGKRLCPGQGKDGWKEYRDPTAKAVTAS